MDNETKNRLLQSIEADRLVILCGAGLSMAPPSNLPSAWSLAEICYKKHCKIDPEFDRRYEHDLEGIAEYFAGQSTLVSYFIRALVPWARFLKKSNLGHEAIADFLICRAICATISSNYDQLIETPAREHGFDLEVAMDGDDATVHSRNHSPLLKFHGCTNDRDHTVWTKSQLEDDVVVVERLRKNKTWMEANLREKDILVIGFWSDWSYLNDIVGSAFENVTPLSLTVVDLSEENALEEKAPILWEKSHYNGVNFYHIQESGAYFLDQLRCEFSKSYMRKLLSQGAPILEAESGEQIDITWLEQPDLSSKEHYGWRCNAEGVLSSGTTKGKNPPENEVLGYFHLLLRKNGAEVSGENYIINDHVIRVVNGAGRFLSRMEKDLVEPPVFESNEKIVCVGALDSGLPADIVRSGKEQDILRPKSSVEFITQERAREIIGI